MNLLLNEIKIGATKDEKIVLTNFRIFQEELKFGSNYHLSIHLEDISSIEMHYKSNPILLILGILLSFYGFYNILTSHHDKTPGFTTLFLGIVFLLTWWFTRRFAVSIKPNGGKSLDCFFEATSPDNIDKFLNLLEQAKLDRVNNKTSNYKTSNTDSNFAENTTKKSNNSNLKCPNCHHKILENDVFCENCGNKLK